MKKEIKKKNTKSLNAYSNEENKKIITKSKLNKISLKELFEKHKYKKMPKEFEWDEPVGRKIW